MKRCKFALGYNNWSKDVSMWVENGKKLTFLLILLFEITWIWGKGKKELIPSKVWDQTQFDHKHSVLKCRGDLLVQIKD